MQRTLQIKPLDPLMIRDGRPFGNTPGARAHTLNTVTPGVLAGTIRTLLGKYSSKELSNSSSATAVTRSMLTKMNILGPLHMLGDRLFFPMPLDVDIYELTDDDQEQGRIHISARRPCKPRENVSFKEEGFLGTGKIGLHEQHLWPVVMPDGLWKPLKSLPAYISSEWMERWLCDNLTAQDWKESLDQWYNSKHTQNGECHFMAPFIKETRVHTAIDECTSTAKDQALFSSEAIVFPDDVTLVARLQVPGPLNLPKPIRGIHSFGGKRRLALFNEITEKDVEQRIWQCPQTVLKAIDSNPRYLRMVLTTPAYFAKGWLPGWLNEQLESNDRLPNLRLKLRWACIPRWEGISGWSYRHKQPKAVRRMVPAGSVYFFEVLSGDPVEFARTNWLKPMSDEDSRKGSFDKSDGCGMAIWGTWSPKLSI